MSIKSMASAAVAAAASAVSALAGSSLPKGQQTIRAEKIVNRERKAAERLAGNRSHNVVAEKRVDTRQSTRREGIALAKKMRARERQEARKVRQKDAPRKGHEGTATSMESARTAVARLGRIKPSKRSR